MSKKSQSSQSQVEFDPETGFVSELFDAAAPKASTPPGGTASLEQVREILFGAHSRSLEQRLAALEQSLERSLAQLTAETAARFAGLEDHLKSEVTALLEQLGSQREEVLKQVQAVTEDLEMRSTALGGELAREITQLRSDLVDRATLSTLFAEAAMQVGSSETPGFTPGPTDLNLDDLSTI